MKVAIIGCGNMGSAFAERLSRTYDLYLYNHHFEKAEALQKKGFGKACKDIEEAISNATIVILAVKPQNINEIGKLIGDRLNKEQILVSLLAGVSIDILHSFFKKPQIIRMMPNLALLYGEGVIGLSTTENILQKNKEELTTAFEIFGKVYWLPEDKINSLAALTGSGPAFIFSIVEAMIDSGIAMGFNASLSKELVLQMIKGSLTLLEKTSKHPGELKWQITSPQGTTIAGLKTFEELAVRGAIINTFLSTYEKGNKLV